MKKYLLSLLVAACALLIPAQAKAYSREMAQLATELNSQLSGQDGIQQISYDGKNLVITLQKGQLSAEEESMLSNINDPEQLKPYVLACLKGEGMDSESLQMFGQILAMFDANLSVILPLSHNDRIELILTPSDLQNL
ncbi:MAG: hypothetical protein HDS66_09640 [Bacteroidales bacterium]|nr:hypothetical protein [Bacteroidales bacterium]